MKRVFLIFMSLMFIMCLVGCETHTHSYTLKFDENSHYDECSCGEKKEINNHNFVWIIDRSPTQESIGLKHQECDICQYKINENTEIEKSKKDVITFEIPTPLNSVVFNNGEELENFLKDNKIYCLYINEISKKDNELNIYNINYRLNFDEEKDGVYTNPYVSVSFSLYSNILGKDNNDEYTLNHSISFLFNLGKYEKNDDLKFEFYEYKNDKLMYNNVIYLYSGELKIGEVYYYEKLNISYEWLQDFIKENLKKCEEEIR